MVYNKAYLNLFSCYARQSYTYSSNELGTNIMDSMAMNYYLMCLELRNV